ncbi:MAG: tRNA glutamyl-Q(34) synthetase GluQRS [Burkholderiales bacterium]|nr:tRNA glutamyl-Q(34) synthetase GluQRS [Burkholderiales bacterium]
MAPAAAAASGPYRGRFAPSPTGPLHAGSLVAALGSWLDARAHGGRWLLRLEDTDTPRCVAGAEAAILGQLAACGLVADAPPLRQSARGPAYGAALEALRAAGRAYPCACTRKDIEAHWAARGVRWPPEAETPYPGTCRGGLQGRPARAWRFRVDTLDAGVQGIAGPVHWHDRRLGPQQQDVAQAVGDFVLQRADGLWAYQLAVVVDDAAQGITDVVRGEDLADNTPRQILLQRALGVPAPRYLHLPLVRAADGRKLSKQNGAEPLDLRDPVAALQAAGTVLGLPRIEAAGPGAWLAQAVPAWAGIIAAFATRSRR